MGRLTPSVLLTGLPISSGAQSTVVDVPYDATWALFSLHYYAATSNHDPTSVSLGGKLAVLKASAHDNTADNVALYSVINLVGGPGQTFAWTNPVTYDSNDLDLAILFFDGVPTFGDAGSGFSGIAQGRATTSALNNAIGDLIFSVHTCDQSSRRDLGPGQVLLEEGIDPIGAQFGFSMEIGAGTPDVQSVTGDFPGIASVVVSVAYPGRVPLVDISQLVEQEVFRPQGWSMKTASWW